eukprot:TRINITY_DN34896_c0_g1_i1.p1 TRINITY_DN34896_c0_g1~~TRINITY_DN34896_c0_g1_i1.p1  ORF type:complete len:165 (+),score=22.73 TRINITY_DN34896_c0_g1_i1:142-636(+)
MPGEGSSEVSSESAEHGVPQDSHGERSFEAIIRDVVAHYMVSSGSVVLRRDGALRVASQWSHCGDCIPEALGTFGDHIRLFHHHVDRALPVIIEDVAGHPRLMDDPLVREHRLKFYAAAPLISSTGTCLGVLAITDTRSTREFTLIDAEFLIQKAAEVTQAIQL